MNETELTRKLGHVEKELAALYGASGQRWGMKNLTARSDERLDYIRDDSRR